jgi:hypothetical protein
VVVEAKGGIIPLTDPAQVKQDEQATTKPEEEKKDKEGEQKD